MLPWDIAPYVDIIPLRTIIHLKSNLIDEEKLRYDASINEFLYVQYAFFQKDNIF
jgi:hypothetical protein